MPGEKNLSALLSTMKPVLHSGDYVFCTTRSLAGMDATRAISMIQESEGFSLILEKEIADQLELNYSFIASWITLTVHSSLEAVGLTAAFSNALAREQVSCNVVAGYYHDHIFIDKQHAERAMQVLERLSKSTD